jgi:signal transduction histidine kinase
VRGCALIGTVSRPSRRGLTYALAEFGLGTILYAAGFPLVFGPDSALWTVPGWARLILLAAICSLELLQTKAPLRGLLAGLVLAAIDATLGLSLAVLIVLTGLLYSAVLNGSQRVAHAIVVTVGVLIVSTAVLSLVLLEDLRQALQAALQLSAIPLIPVWWAMNVRRQRETAEAERARADQLARIAELDRRAAVAAERSRMARDLHDVIAGHLSAIAIQSEAALSIVDGDRETMRTVLKSVRENSVASLTEMRTMIGLLRSDEADALTAPTRLSEMDSLLDSARAAGLRVVADVSPGANLPVAADLSAYRILQEALTNAVKHAPGSRAEVVIARHGDVLVVEVTNELTAALRANANGTGLLNMRERAAIVGGTLTAGPDENGWRVRAELPVGES